MAHVNRPARPAFATIIVAVNACGWLATEGVWV
jgi:hypothetical protein